MSEPDRLAEFKDYRDELYGKNLVGPKDLIDIRVDALDWLIGEVERLRMQQDYVAMVAARDVERLRGPLKRLATETLLARAVIHELTWGQIVITEHPRLRDALRAWGEDDKVGTPELKRLAAEQERP